MTRPQWDHAVNLTRIIVAFGCILLLVYSLQDDGLQDDTVDLADLKQMGSGAAILLPAVPKAANPNPRRAAQFEHDIFVEHPATSEVHFQGARLSAFDPTSRPAWRSTVRWCSEKLATLFPQRTADPDPAAVELEAPFRVVTRGDGGLH